MLVFTVRLPTKPPPWRLAVTAYDRKWLKYFSTPSVDAKTIRLYERFELDALGKRFTNVLLPDTEGNRPKKWRTGGNFCCEWSHRVWSVVKGPVL